jgi:hypothetical protein
MNKIFLILMMLILGSVLIFAGCKQEEKADTTPPVTQPVTQPAVTEPETPSAQPTGEQAAPAEQVPQELVPIEVPASDKLLSGITCVDRKMDAVVTNILDKQIDLSKSIIFVNGILSRVTASCEKKILAPGESASCSGMTGTISMSATKPNKIIFRVSATAQQEELVECK